MPDILANSSPAYSTISDMPSLASDNGGSSQAPDNFSTALSPQEMQQFNSWVRQNNIAHNPAPNAGYDTEGFWKAMMSGDPKSAGGFSAQSGLTELPYWMTPFHPQFGPQSQYANQMANAPANLPSKPAPALSQQLGANALFNPAIGGNPAAAQAASKVPISNAPINRKLIV
jgi:hypothetical protein